MHPPPRARAAGPYRRATAVAVRIVSLGAALAFAALVPAHALVLPPGLREPLIAAASASAVLFFLAWRAARRPAFDPRAAEPLMAAVLAVVLANGALHLALTRDPVQTTNLMLLVVAAGLFLLEFRWFVLLAGGAAGAWLAVASADGPDAMWRHFGFALAFAIVVAGLLLATRRRTYAGLEAARVREASLRREVERQAAAERRSRTWLDSVLAAAGDAILVMDADGRGRFANPAARVLLGYDAHDLAGRPVHDLVHPVRANGAPCSADACPLFARARAGAVAKGEDALTRRDGARVPVQFSLAPMLEGGLTVGVVAIFRDVTEERRARGALEESEARFRAVFENSPLGIAIVGPDLRLAAANRALAEKLGYATAELVGMSATRLAHPADADQMVAQARQLFDGTLDEYWMERRYVGKDGRVVWGNVAVSSVKDASGRPLHLVAIIEDVTLRRRVEEALRAQRDEIARAARDLSSANRELEAFNYSVSHDLRAPIRAVEYLSGAILEDHGRDLDPEAREELTRLRAESRRMAQIVEDLLGLSRISRAEIRRERVDLSEIAWRVATDLRLRDPDRRVEFEIQDDVEADADPRLARVVLDNLLGNAWKYTSKRDLARIEWGAIDRAGERVFFVRDNGAGFDMSRADQLFVPFRRLHAPTEFPGTGIGLATVERIVRKHGGLVWAEGEPDRGATFWFTLGPSAAEGARAPADVPEPRREQERAGPREAGARQR